MVTPIIYSDEFEALDYGEGHPFRGSRFSEFRELLRGVGVDDDGSFEFVSPKTATDEDLLLVHDPAYIEKVYELEKVSGMLSPDTQVLPGLPDAAKLLTGASIQAARLVAEGKAAAKNETNLALAFGGFHHAGKGYGEGFCVFNDVAITAEMLSREYAKKKILIIDTDAHQGNGTMDIFFDRADVLFISIHQDPRTLYPGKGFPEDVGRGDGEGFTVNICMPPYASDLQYRHALAEVFVPIAKEYKPDIIIRNGGSDPFFWDELTHLQVTFEGLREIAATVRRVTDETCKRQVDLTCSGYGDYVTQGWLALFSGTTGFDVELPTGIKKPPMERMEELRMDYETKQAVKRLLEIQGEYWSCF